MRVEDLVGYDEIAHRIRERSSIPELRNLKMRTVHTWRQRHTHFPEPVKELKMGPVFNWPDVEKWAIGTGRIEE